MNLINTRYTIINISLSYDRNMSYNIKLELILTQYLYYTNYNYK